MSPAQTRTSKLRSANNAKLGRKSSIESLSNSQQQQSVINKRPSSPSPKRPSSPSVKRIPSPVMNKSASSSSVSKRASSPVLKRSPSPLPKRSASPNPKNTISGETDLITKKNNKQQRAPDLARLSALAKPRRRNCEPANTSRSLSTPVKKTCNPIRKASMRSKSPRLANIRSRFTRPETSTSRDNNKTDDEYFVEIFAPTATATEENSTPCKKSDEYSSDSLFNEIDHSKTNDSLLLVGDVLAEIRNTDNMPPYDSDNPVKDENGIDTASGPVAATRDTIDQEDGFITMKIDSLNTVKKNNESASSIKKLLACSPPSKSPLFSPLLEKIKQSSSNAAEKVQNKRYFVFPTTTDSKTNTINKINNSGQTLKISPSDQSSLSLSGDIPIDSLSFSMSSSKNNDTSCDHDDDEKTWANSRGIKFTGNSKPTTTNIEEDGKKKITMMNDTFTINGKLSSSRSISGECDHFLTTYRT